MVYFREDSDFVISEFAEFRSMFKLLDIHDFDSKVLMIFLVLSLIDVAVLSLSDFLDENVILDNFVH